MQLSAEDTYDVAGKVVELPISKVRPSKSNPRSELGNLEPLAASIREAGVLQPITVFPVGDDFEIMYGARRHAASELAGQMTIPAIVLPKPEDGKALLNRIIENLQREDPSPVDEARAFERLRDDFGLTQTEIADRVGCSQPHVAKRLALLELPMQARDMIGKRDDDGKPLLTLAAAQELTKLAGAPDRIKKILKASRDDRDWMIEEEVEDHEAEVATAAAAAEIAAKGLTVVDAAAVEDLEQIATEAEYVWRHKAIRFKQPKRHEKEPCHVVTVTGDRYRDKPTITAYCNDPARHTEKGDSKLKRLAAPKNGTGGASKSTQQKNKERAEREAAKARKAFMSELVQTRPIGEVGTDLVDLVVDRYLADAAHVELLKMCDLLGLELPKKGPKDPQAEIKKYLKHATATTSGFNGRLRACLAFALVQGEWTSSWAHGDSHHALLIDAGYEPSPLERKEWKLDKRDTPKRPTTAAPTARSSSAPN